MTGEKNRFTTTEKLWNLDDKQLATPKHDELVLMLLDEEYVKKKIIGADRNIMAVNISSEQPIVGSNRFIIGYEDIVVESVCEIERVASTPEEYVQILCPHCHYQMDRITFSEALREVEERKRHCCNKCGTITTTSAESVELHYTVREYDTYHIECKPQITSFGETLRQLKTYRMYILSRSCPGSSSNKFILFTPDARFKAAFESQGITVISP